MPPQPEPTPPTPPNIAVDLRALVGSPTGIGVYTESVLLHLARSGRARYLGLAHRPPADAATLAAAGIALEHQPAPLGVLWQQLRLPQRLRRGDVDLLWAPLMTLPRWLPVPAVVTVHDITTLLFPETHRLKVRLSILPFLRDTLESAARVIVPSQATAADLRFHFPQCTARLRVIPHAVDPVFAPAAPAEIAATRERLGCPGGYLLYGGTIEPRKNLLPLLDAWEMLVDADPKTPPLVLAGGYGWRSRALVRRAERLAARGLRVLGRLERAELVRVFQAASVFVYPSFYEGFGLPAAEALACGVPTVASAASSLPEVVGNAGLLVPAGDALALAEAIRRVLDDPALAAELGARGRERAAAAFRWERSAAEHERVFGEVITL